MTATTVNAENLSKRYWRHGQVRADTFRDAIASPFRRKASVGRSELWAIRDVTFSMQRGETLGIVGANGSGKSTLLKILSRVIEPTSGEFQLVGRTASLLEVGTGFHHELTGRENMMFNGSLLGLSRKEIERKADEIFEFAGVEDFADTPVKHYSTGMYVRLAFAVAAQLEPDIFIVDEALAVGDFQFQQRCVDRMKKAAHAGQTILFVTHSLGFVESLCDRALLLENGRVGGMGPSDEIVSAYLDTAVLEKPVGTWTRSDREEQPGWNPVVPHSLKFVDSHGREIQGLVKRGMDCFAELDFEMLESSVDVSVGITMLSQHNVRLLRSTPFDEQSFDGLKAGRYQWIVRLPTELLTDGSYTVCFDADRFESAWYHNPYNTPAKIGFALRGGVETDTLRLWHPEREGSVKVALPWIRTEASSAILAC